MSKRHRGYSEFVEHPRFGRGPRYTTTCPRDVPLGYRLTTYNASHHAIEGTAVEADLERQSASPVPALYYFDLTKTCIDCHRPFIFFAEEQKYWYETLGFYLDTDCVRCVECRKREQGHERHRRRYIQLLKQDQRSPSEDMEMAECLLALIDGGDFHKRQTERVRILLNRIAKQNDGEADPRYNILRDRLIAIETALNGEQRDAPKPRIWD